MSEERDAAHGVPALGPWVLTRVAGLPANACDIVHPDTVRLLDELARVRAALESTRDTVQDLCFALVPQLDGDVALRRAVLAGKRAVHRLRPLPWDADAWRRVGARVGPVQAEAFRAWQHGVEQLKVLRAELADRVRADRRDGTQLLLDQLDQPGFAPALALAAPDWVRHGRPAQAVPDRGALDQRNLRTLYSYVSRAAVKTSPFSRLTTVGIAGSTGSGRAHSYPATALAFLALQVAARDPELAGRIAFETALVRPGDENATAGYLLHGEPVALGGVCWRLDQAVEAEHAVPWLRSLNAVVPAELPPARLRRLLDAGLIRAVPPWRRDEEPLSGLTRQLGAAPSTLLDEIAAVRLAGQGVADAATPARVQAVTTVRTIAERWRDRAGLDLFRTGELLFEDVETDLALPEVCTESVRDDLRELGRRIRPYVFRSHLYDVLVDRFVAEYGPGGRCTDALGFLMRLAVTGDGNTVLDGAYRDDLLTRGRCSDRAGLPVGPSSAPPAAAVLFQLAADHPQSLRTGRYQLVVNQFNPGTGGLLSRFGGLLGPAFTQPLREHLAAGWPQARPHEVIDWTECNTAQSRSGRLFPPLVLPYEVPDPAGLPLTSTTLVHDRVDGTLTLYGPDGVPVGLPYLGIVPPHLHPPLSRLLLVLADPWINGSPLSDYTLPSGLRDERQDDVIAIARAGFGRVVTRRRAWVVPVAALPRPSTGESDADLVERADTWRRRHEIPTEVFCHQLVDLVDGPGAERKPMWASLASAMSLTVLAQWLAPETRHVRLVETLPARGMHPLRDAAGNRRTSEQVGLLRWARPEEDRR